MVIAMVINTGKIFCLNALISEGKLKFYSYPYEIINIIVMIRKSPEGTIYQAFCR